jgi:hypothetical protein
MTDFSNYSALRPSAENPSDYTPPSLPSITLKVLPASDANPKYFNAFLARGEELRAANPVLPGQKPRPATAEKLEEIRQVARELFAEHVIVGWEGVVDTAGAEVNFTPKRCLEFLQAIPNYSFDEIQNFAMQPRNFSSASGN